MRLEARTTPTRLDLNIEPECLASQEPIVETNTELLQGFLESIETLRPHLRSKVNAWVGPNDRRPIILNHTARVSLLHPHDGVADASLQRLGRPRRCKNGVKNTLMEKVHDFALLAP